eukprot:TRINITY_DN20530_c0_g1_i2.p1 TRINITY_DN20530_c0_g1~~TRINITY_DN20530_c0_g1_i2.p1  ORF type:complete len:284 (+),score=34.03 TRINITY_DN20530_c0_g1_i2:96-854(+)
MAFSIYYPPACADGPVRVVMFLSGMTCTNQNFVTTAGAQKLASKLGIAIVNPDTSPRGLGIEGEDETWSFGTGAGFYVDATEPKWKNYRMYSYITKELIDLLRDNVKELDLSRMSLAGHSMGGHGALTIALKNPDMFKSISALCPICHPSKIEVGQNAFKQYLGEDEEAWKQYDAVELLKSYSGPKLSILADQGTEDGFHKDGQLMPEALVAANAHGQVDLTLRYQDGYDHDVFFIASFIDEHLEFHASKLC